MEAFKTLKTIYNNNLFNTHNVYYEGDLIVNIFKTGDVRFYSVHYADGLSDTLRADLKLQVSGKK